MAVAMFSQLVGPSRIASSADTEVAPQASPRTAASAPRTPQPHQRVERGSWLIGIAASGFAGFLLWKFQIDVEPESLALFSGLMGFLLAVDIVYGRWRSAPVLSNLAAAVAVFFWSAAAAATISLVGLRYKFPLIDDSLAEADRLIGIDLPSIIPWFANHPWLTELLAAAYCSSFVQITALFVLLAATRRFDKLWQLVFVFALTIVASTMFSVFWPAKGAFVYFDHPLAILKALPEHAGNYHLAKFEYFRNAAAPELSLSNLQGVVTLPSFHTCLALMTFFATIGTRWLFGITLIWNLLVLVSTIPIGGHYVIDLTCGALLWLAAMKVEAMLGRSSMAMRAMPMPAAVSA
ncbi:phosphatase PAP2 family protein [Bradyrhizobium sp. UFLA03-84]|uniref:phosphatase PAP2 family protein n=1 Tax=Bradyrhizobium sp. UFLA03-84 TaxID=418599 RepID=UPI0013045638|nr:phosphatase PAP2 family protein [Bradyrhizobium sp. UFLA03-84]